MGQTECTVAVSNPFLSNCERYAHYMQVNFTCIPSKSLFSHLPRQHPQLGPTWVLLGLGWAKMG